MRASVCCCLRGGHTSAGWACVRRRRLVAARPAATVAGGVGMDALVSFEWKAALGDRPIARAELRRLEAAADAKQALVRVRGEWVELRPADLAIVRAYLGTGGEATVAEILRAGLGLDSLDVPDDVEITGVDATGWLARCPRRCAARDGHSRSDAGRLRRRAAPVPGARRRLARVSRPARPRRVPRRRHGARQDGPAHRSAAWPTLRPRTDTRRVPRVGARELGTGARRASRRSYRCSSTTAPTGSRRHERSFPKRARRADVVLTTYSLVARDAEHLVAVPWARLVLDEAQQVKNPGTAQTRAVRRIIARPTSRADRHAGREPICPSCGRSCTSSTRDCSGSARSFRERLRDADRTGSRRRGHRAAASHHGAVRAPPTEDRPIVIGDLPDKIETTEACPLTREQATLYQAVVDDLVEQSEDAEGMSRRGLVLAGLMRLKQVCNHPAHFLRDGSALSGRSGKLTRTEELLDEILAEGDKVLCFTQFTEWGGLLAPYFQRRFGVEVGWLHGRVTRRKRDDLVGHFQKLGGTARAPRLAEGGRDRFQPHGRFARRPPRPLVEPCGRGPGDRSGVSHRSDAAPCWCTSW